MAYNNTQNKLTNIYSYSFPGVHLLSISLVKQENLDKEYKNSYFCFITLLPGKQDQNSTTGRSFDKDNAVRLKVEADKLLGFAHTLRFMGRGSNQQFYSKFSILVDSSKSQYTQNGAGTIKSIFFAPWTDQKNENQVVGGTIFFKAGQNKAQAYMASFPALLAMADVAEFIAKKCMELEFGGNEIQVKARASIPPTRPATTQQPQQNNTQQQSHQSVVDQFKNNLSSIGASPEQSNDGFPPISPDEDIPF